jgi:two-component system cell cycle sensor histidine kinase/response regulator CckA
MFKPSYGIFKNSIDNDHRGYRAQIHSTSDRATVSPSEAIQKAEQPQTPPWIFQVFDHVSDSILIIDTQLRVERVNLSAEFLTGWTNAEAVGRPLEEIFHLYGTDLLDRIRSLPLMEDRQAEIITMPRRTLLKDRNGQILYIAGQVVSLKGNNSLPYGWMLVFQDFSDRIQLERELVKAQKFESLGNMAGGISHDFNNILASLIGNLQLAKLDCTPSTQATQKLNLAEKALQRAVELNQQLMSFAMKNDLVCKPTDVERLIREAVKLTMADNHIDCRIDIDPSISPIDMDEGRINQVLTNLLINAKQAMPDGGTVWISAKEEIIRKGAKLPLASGRYVRVTVRDQGSGIPPHLLIKIFDPYFTTKPEGHGFGLSTAFRIVKDHGGHISVTSTPNKETNFAFYLPMSQAPPI